MKRTVHDVRPRLQVVTQVVRLQRVIGIRANTVPDHWLPPSRGIVLTAAPANDTGRARAQVDDVLLNRHGVDEIQAASAVTVEVRYCMPLVICACRLAGRRKRRCARTARPSSAVDAVVARTAPGTPAAADALAGRQRGQRGLTDHGALATLRASTSGVSPVTTTVSVRAPTRSSALIVATKLGVSSNPSRLNVANPASVKLRE